MKNKKSLLERFTTYFNPKNWQKKTKITTAVVAIILVSVVNKISRKVNETSLW